MNENAKSAKVSFTPNGFPALSRHHTAIENENIPPVLPLIAGTPGIRLLSSVRPILSARGYFGRDAISWARKAYKVSDF